VLPKTLGWLDQATQVIVVQRFHDWAEVLLPARKTLPSKVPGSPAQTVGWIPASDLVADHALPEKIVISTARQTLDIVSTATEAVERSYPVSTGADGMPSPTGTTYIQARYSDAQNQHGEGVINLLAIHIVEADSVYGDGAGLVALHAQPAAGTADRSHGCIRLDDPAAETVISAMPLGTVVKIS
jgi:lipoprotein-anchoring transpeptidase ErfK/SrfK